MSARWEPQRRLLESFLSRAEARGWLDAKGNLKRGKSEAAFEFFMGAFAAQKALVGDGEMPIFGEGFLLIFSTRSPVAEAREMLAKIVADSK